MTIDYAKIAENIEASKKSFDQRAAEQKAEGKAAAIEWLQTSESTVSGTSISLPNLFSYETLQEVLLRDEGGPALLKGKSELFAKAFRDEVRRIDAKIKELEAV